MDNIVVDGDTIDAHINPIREGYVFGGWYDTAVCDTSEINFPYTVINNTRLYANGYPSSTKCSMKLNPSVTGGEWTWVKIC